MAQHKRWVWSVVLTGALVALVAPLQLLDNSAEDLEELPVARVARQAGRPQAGGGGSCTCVPLVVCVAELNQLQQTCTTTGREPGVCCPASAVQTRASPVNVRLFTGPSESVSLSTLDSNRLSSALDKGENSFNNIQEIERNLIDQSLILPLLTPAGQHLHFFTIPDEAKAMDRRATAIIFGSTQILDDFDLTPRQAGFGLRNLAVSNTDMRDLCPQNPTCTPNSKYRTADGSCNNLANPTWGMSNTPTQRILPPTYDDGVYAPRTRAVDGSPLPNVRQISSNVFVDVNRPDEAHTLTLMQWGQFLDHDFAHVPFPTMENGMGIQCCPNGTMAPTLHPRCFPIDTTGDPFYGPRGSRCMNFIRSMLAVGPGPACNFGYAQQLNQITHWIDASNVYGSTPNQQRAIRSFRNGLLLTSGNNLLPINPNQNTSIVCRAEERGALCYLAGDSRANQHPHITAIQILFLREHNRVARELQALNPQWSDEAVFQETRRIVAAIIQHITYNEFLPIVLGENFMRSFGIDPRLSGYVNNYRPDINPNMNIEFSTAAYRFGHSMAQGTLRLFTANGGVDTVRLRDHFNSPNLIQIEGRLDDIVRSFTQLASQRFDAFVVQDLTNHLFQTARFTFGLDLPSLNMQRGRDHGIATYNSMREACRLPRARSFNDFADQMSPQAIQKLARIYKSVDDVDLFAGGLSETPIPGSLLGWTFLCVVGDQFARLKFADRYFYDLGGQPGSFTEPQLQQIRRSSWARIMCDNSNIGASQPLAFRLTSHRLNQPVPCNSPIIPRLNFAPWRGERPAA
ncbi:salivary peroxidase/catechol oxidase isoform X1 [Procambarus clarkii]|uniref:salivary peroxidase/catechol oxidase isoform X1 n=1 Tax=Procambarus clarkii TaxID=6728 RepID=UPI0037428064